MILNEFYDGQGLGNQLWNYAVARIAADRNGCGFSIIGRERFKGRAFMDLDMGVPNAAPPEHHYRERTEYLRGTDIDISRSDPRLLELAPSTKFDGTCQSARYLEGYRERLMEWMNIKDEYLEHRTDDDVCVIHLRAGDFRTQKDVFLPREYYRHAMAHVRDLNKNVRFCCVTDEMEVAERMLPGIEIMGSAVLGTADDARAAHHRGGPVGIDFVRLKHARYLIIPNSSFSWWAAYLNTRAEVIVAPKYWARHNVSDGYWSTSDIITDGFTYIDRVGSSFTADQCGKEKDAYQAAHPGMFSPFPMRAPSFPGKRFLGRLWHFGRGRLKHGMRRIEEYLLDFFRYPRLRQKAAIVCDAFIFFNELELLEIRLNILDGYVDRFAIVEANRTFTGKPKPLYYLENKERFRRWEGKIVHCVIDNMPSSMEEVRRRLMAKELDPMERGILEATLAADNIPRDAPHWLREYYQKESIKKALAGLDDMDICFISDVDEIWNPRAAIDFSKDAIFKMRQKMYAYYLNNRSSERWSGTFATRYKNIKHGSINRLDHPDKNRYVHVRDGGWHFTNLGGADRIRIKLESYGHQEFNNEEIKQDLENKIAVNRDYIGRQFKFWRDEKDLPEYLADNRSRYEDLFK